MTRSAWKLPYISLIFFQKRFLNRSVNNIRLRNSLIPSIFIEKSIKICVFNGIWYLSIIITNSMLFCKFGEFSFTKRSDTQTHLKRKTKKKSKGKK
jgi:ribosomal protein S19